ncbi:MAG TPA: gluconokinase [Lacunisphaera sp.]|jgi:gluconokinase
MATSPHSRIVLIMGVAGSGKTTVGRMLAAQLDWPYFEADDFHSAANKTKMGHGIPLDDDDRAPWLVAIRQRIDECVAGHQSAVFSCSALKESYRHILMDRVPSISLVYLAGDPATLLARMRGRSGHYMKPDMLQSQLATLEVPHDALNLDITQPPETIVAEIRESLNRIN